MRAGAHSNVRPCYLYLYSRRGLGCVMIQHTGLFGALHLKDLPIIKNYPYGVFIYHFFLYFRILKLFYSLL
jgi:hypothetical protein